MRAAKLQIPNSQAPEKHQSASPQPGTFGASGYGGHAAAGPARERDAAHSRAPRTGRHDAASRELPPSRGTLWRDKDGVCSGDLRAFVFTIASPICPYVFVG
jgi:hypothetical protein